MNPKDPAVLSTYETAYSPSQQTSSWNPKTWSRRIWLFILAGILVVVAAVVGGVVGTRAKGNDGAESSYPNYSQLNYTLIDTCEWKLKFRLCLGNRIWGEMADMREYRLGDVFL